MVAQHTHAQRGFIKLMVLVSVALVLFFFVFRDSVHTVQAVRILLLPLCVVSGHPLLGATGKTFTPWKNTKENLLLSTLPTMLLRSRDANGGAPEEQNPLRLYDLCQPDKRAAARQHGEGRHRSSGSRAL